VVKQWTANLGIASVLTRSKGKVTTVTFIAFIFHLLIGLGDNTIPDLFKFTRSKVKVVWVTFVISYVNNLY